MIKKEAKQLVKLITSFIFFIICANNGNAQTKRVDSTAFKKDFEQLLSKYGLSNEHYLINITSYNQAGGQTAFVINNNYYSEAAVDSSNVTFKILDENGKRTLVVSPIKGSWISPFVMTDSTRAKKPFFDIGAGYVQHIYGIVFCFEDKEYYLTGGIPDGACSKISPIHISLLNDDAAEFFIFGDFQENNKTYLYYKGRVTWCPRPDIP